MIGWLAVLQGITWVRSDNAICGRCPDSIDVRGVMSNEKSLEGALLQLSFIREMLVEH
jgi:hypothetical protein